MENSSTMRQETRTPIIFPSEYKLCLIVWETEPIGSTDLARICNERLHWTKSTTYTVIRRLSDRGIIENKNCIITSLISKGTYQTDQIDRLIDDCFDGSVTHFANVLLKNKLVSKEELSEILSCIKD